MNDHKYLYHLYETAKKSSHPWQKPPKLLKRRGWAFEVYPDNTGNIDIGLSGTPEEWIQILRDEFLHAYIILHDKDKDPDGNPKKLHYHVMLMWDGPVTAEYADQYRNMVGGVGLQPIASIKQYARYLCHLDNPEKYPYSVTDVLCIGTADYIETIENSFNRAKCIEQMTRYVDQNNVKTFRGLVKFARDFNSEWYMCLLDNVSFMKQYIADKRYEEGLDRIDHYHDVMEKFGEDSHDLGS